MLVYAATALVCREVLQHSAETSQHTGHLAKCTTSWMTQVQVACALTPVQSLDGITQPSSQHGSQNKALQKLHGGTLGQGAEQ